MPPRARSAGTLNLGRAGRLLLLCAAVAAWAYAISFGAGLRTGQTHGLRAPAARAVVPGTEDVLALEQAGAAQAAAEAHNPRNLVFTSDHSVYAQVGSYTDCSGHTALTRAEAAIDTCVTGLTYFIGHNPGVFTGLMKAGVGTLIGYYDGSGHLTRFEVVAVRESWPRSDGVPPPARPDEAAQFQTCVTLDGSVDRILDAVAV